MLRDFSQENLTAFNQFVRTASPDKNDQIAKLAESLISKYQTQLSRIGGITPVRAIASANNETGSLIRMSDSKVQSAFTAVTAEDAQFPLDTQDALTAVKEAMNALEEVNNAGSNAVNKGLKLWDAFNPDAIQEVTASSNEKLKAKEAELEDKLQANNVTNSEGDPDEIVEEIDLDRESRIDEIYMKIKQKLKDCDNLQDLYGDQEEITEEDWIAYAKLIDDLKERKKIRYPKPSDKTILQKTGHQVVLDCQAVNNLAMRLFLSEEKYKEYASEGRNTVTAKTGDIDKLLTDQQATEDKKQSGKTLISTVPIPATDNEKVDTSQWKSGDVLLIEYNKKKEGSDHAVTVVKDYPSPGKTSVINSFSKDEPVEVIEINNYIKKLKNSEKITLEEIKRADYYAYQDAVGK